MSVVKIFENQFKRKENSTEYIVVYMVGSTQNPYKHKKGCQENIYFAEFQIFLLSFIISLYINNDVRIRGQYNSVYENNIIS